MSDSDGSDKTESDESGEAVPMMFMDNAEPLAEPEMMDAMAPAMMMAEPEFADAMPPEDTADIRIMANEVLALAEEVVQGNADQISDELKQSVSDKITVLRGLLNAEKEDLEAIEKAIKNLEEAIEKSLPSANL